VPLPSLKYCTVAAASGVPERESTMVPLMVPIVLCEKEKKTLKQTLINCSAYISNRYRKRFSFMICLTRSMAHLQLASVLYACSGRLWTLT
jgi:hypothetical protein